MASSCPGSQSNQTDWVAVAWSVVVDILCGWEERLGMLVMDGKVGGGKAGKRQVPEGQEGGNGTGARNVVV